MSDGPEEIGTGLIAQWCAEVGELFDAVSGGFKGFRAAGNARIHEAAAERVQKAIGVDVSGFYHIMDTNGIRHVLNHHAHLGEAKRGQVPLQREDFLQVIHIVLDPDSIEDSGPHRNGLATVRYVKAMGGCTYYYTQFVRTGKKQLTPVTLYKRRIK